jgi:ABC-type branched-subunit amino acid transport system ATPase component
MAHLLEARDLVKVFPGIRAVDGISFSVELFIAARLRTEELSVPSG